MIQRLKKMIKRGTLFLFSKRRRRDDFGERKSWREQSVTKSKSAKIYTPLGQNRGFASMNEFSHRWFSEGPKCVILSVLREPRFNPWFPGSRDNPRPPPGVHPVYPEVPWLYHMTWVEIKLLFSLIDWFDFTLEGVPGADFDECYKINLQI